MFLATPVAARINRINPRERRREILSLSRALAGVRYDRNLIYRILKESDALEESVVELYADHLEELGEALMDFRSERGLAVRIKQRIATHRTTREA